MRIRRRLQLPPSSPGEILDLESFMDRMHMGDNAARDAYQIFTSHGSVPELDVEENWMPMEAKRLTRYFSGRRAA